MRSFIQQEKREKSIENHFFKTVRLAREIQSDKKNSNFEIVFIKCEKEFTLQSYLHAISRAMWTEQAASTETRELSKTLHNILQVLVQIPDPFCQMQLCLFMERTCWLEAPQRHLQGKGGLLFFFPGHHILPEGL